MAKAFRIIEDGPTMRCCPVCGSTRLLSTTMGHAAAVTDPNRWTCEDCGMMWRALAPYPNSK